METVPTMTYVGKGFSASYDEYKDWSRITTSEQCQDLCKAKYLEDDLWNGCLYSATGQWCEVEKNVEVGNMFVAGDFDYWTLGIPFEMEVKTSGRCASTLTETECEKGTYPRPSITRWNPTIANNPKTDSSLPSGCYVKSSTGYVYFNRAVDGTDCTSTHNCLCKKESANDATQNLA